MYVKLVEALCKEHQIPLMKVSFIWFYGEVKAIREMQIDIE